METYGTCTQVRGKQIGCSLAHDRPKKIHNPLFYVFGHCVCGWAWTHARPRVRVRAHCTRVPAALFIRLIRTSIYRSDACVRVCLHTTFPMLRVSRSVSSSRVAFRASIRCSHLDFPWFCKRASLLFFRCQG